MPSTKPRARSHGRPSRLTAFTLTLDAGLGEIPLTADEQSAARRLRLLKKVLPLLEHRNFSAANSIMEDDVNTSLFTPGCAAYAGYWNGTFANMTAVRAYAASQGARSFSYTPDGTAGADAIDIEPGDASPTAAPAFYNSGGRYFYASAGTTQVVINILSGRGRARSSYKIISAHYTGSPHICGPTVCGFPQADATQFTDRYAGRSLDATLFNASFFSKPLPPPAWPVLRQGASGTAVVTLQTRLEAWGFRSVAADGNFGPATLAAVKSFQAAHSLVADGVVGALTWAALEKSPPPPPPMATATQPAAFHVSARYTNITASWGGATRVTEYVVHLIDAASGLDAQPPVKLPPSASSHIFRHLREKHHYRVGIWARHGAPNAAMQWRDITTR